MSLHMAERLSIIMSALLLAGFLILPTNVAEEQKNDLEGISERVEYLKGELQNIRGIQFKRDIHFSVKSRADIVSIIEQMIDKDYSPQKLDGLKKSLVEFRFIQEDIDIRKIFVDFYSSETAGFYDVDSSTFYIASDIFSKDDFPENLSTDEANKVLQDSLGINLEDFTIFHELQHALVDQNFNIKKMVGNPGNNFDKELALLSTLEGDAYLTNLMFVFSPLGIEAEVTAHDVPLGELAGQGSFSFRMKENEYPPYFVSIFLFPSLQGMDFVREVYHAGGWKAVNALYASPPQSSEQILHPNKYLKDKDLPKEPKLRDLSPLKAKNWKEITEDTLGEFRVYLLIDSMLDKQDTALLASEGWGGDRYFLFENEKGERILYLSTIWDSEKDAREFLDAYGRSLAIIGYNSPGQTDKKADAIRSFMKGNDEMILAIDSTSVEVMKGSPENMKKFFPAKPLPKKP